MAATFLAALALASLACCLADPLPKSDIRWCTVSPAETKKCRAFKDAASYCNLNCVQKSSTHDCIASIANDEADATTLDGGQVYEAGLNGLKPIMVESYGTDEEKDTCYYAVAVVQKGSDFQFSGLKGKKSCHTGLGKTSGWNMPIAALLRMDLIKWEGSDDRSLQSAVSLFFSESCVPGAQEPNLCSLCAGKGDSKCAHSQREPYYGYDGAFKCLTDGKGEVAFVKHLTVPVSQSDKYELLCPDDTRKPLSEYENCNLGKVAGHAVVTQSSGEKSSAIRECLTKAQADFGKKGSSPFHLFSSPDGSRNLLFKDTATRLFPLPESMDANLFLGPTHVEAIQALRKASASPRSDEKKRLRWCAIGKAEKEKCDTWSAVSGNAIACAEGASTEDCIVKIQRREADAMALDGGYMYTAGKCGLVPAMTEYYDTVPIPSPFAADLSPCRTKGSTGTGTYYAVAVVKKSNQDITWDNLKGKKSCHTAVDRTAGWNVPMGRLMKEGKMKDCKFDEFFSESCAPGSDPKSNLCKLCAGSPGLKGEENKCQASNKEQYYGYSGSFRCLVEGGDVAFVKQTTAPENCDGANPADWAKNLKCDDYELLCTNGKRAPLSEYKTCHLAQVPAHGVVTLPDMKPFVVQMLLNQQSVFGREGVEKDMFEMYVSENDKDLLMKDSTQCLLEVRSGKSMEDVLGTDYSSAVAELKKCSSKSDLHAACTFHSCS